MEELIKRKEVIEWQLTFAKDREIVQKLHRQLIEINEQIEIEQLKEQKQ